MAAKRKRQVVFKVTHCKSCEQAMDESPCCINWHAVYVSQLVKAHMYTAGRIPTQEELEEMDQTSGSDPCDDCCCGACGRRKPEPGVACC